MITIYLISIGISCDMAFSPKGDFDHIFYFLQNLMRELYKIRENKEAVMIIYKRILKHKNKCKDEDCLCNEVVDRYFNTMKSEKHENKITSLYSQLVNEIDLIMKKITERTRLDSIRYCKLLVLNVLFSTYFRGQYIISFIILQKIESNSAFKRNTLLRLQISLLKHKIISTFHGLKKDAIKKDYDATFLSYKMYHRYAKVDRDIINIIDIMKKMIKPQKEMYISTFSNILKDFYDTLSRLERRIDKIMKNNNTTDIILQKFVHFYKIFNSDKFNILKYRHNHDFSFFTDKTDYKDIMIIKNTETCKYIIKYVTPLLPESLLYSSVDFIDKDIHELMPDEMTDSHSKHMTAHIEKNNLDVNCKEVFIVNGKGTINMFRIKGSVLLTLNDELYLYATVESLISFYEDNNISYAYCTQDGEILKVDSSFQEVFLYDNLMIGLLRLNIFELLDLKKWYLDRNMVKDIYNMKIDAKDFYSKIEKTDTSKLYDFDNITYLNYLQRRKKFDLEKFKNLVISFEKRTFLNDKYFYIVRIYNHNSKSNLKDSLITKTLIHDKNFLETYHNSDELRLVYNTINQIKYFSLKALNMPDIDDSITMNEKEPVRTEAFKQIKLKNKKHKLFFSILIYFMLIGALIFANIYKKNIFYQSQYLSDFKYLIYKINKYSNYLTCLCIDDFISGEKNIESQILLNHYVELIKDFKINYFLLDDTIRINYAQLIGGSISVKALGMDWIIYEYQENFFNFLDDFKYSIFRLTYYNTDTNIDLYNYPNMKQNVTSSKFTDQSLVFIIENNNIDNIFDKLTEKNNESYSIYINDSKMTTVVIYGVFCVIILILTSYNSYIYYTDSEKIFKRFFIIFTILDYHRFLLLSKLTIFEDLLTDYTQKTYNRVKGYKLDYSGTKDEKNFLNTMDIVTEINEKDIRKLDKRHKTLDDDGFINTNIYENRMQSTVNNMKTNFDMQTSLAGFIHNNNKSGKEGYSIYKNSVKKDKLTYLLLIFFLIFSITLFGVCLFNLLYVLRLYELLYADRINDSIFLNKNNLINNMMVDYKISIVNKKTIVTNTFEEFKSEYFSFYKDFKQNITVTEVDNYIKLLGNNMCNELSKVSKLDYTNCTLINGGLNNKGYYDMINSLYEGLFFLYEDLSYSYKHGLYYNVSKLPSLGMYNGLMEDYYLVVYDSDEMFIEIMMENDTQSLDDLKSRQDIISISLIIQVFLLCCFYVIFIKVLPLKKYGMALRIENVLINAIHIQI
jgi:hypothetical protein